jgi:hypothetical protein
MDLMKEDITIDNSKGKDNQKMDLMKEDITIDSSKEKDSLKMDLMKEDITFDSSKGNKEEEMSKSLEKKEDTLSKFRSIRIRKIPLKYLH